MRRLVEREWAIVPAGSGEEIELPLHLCVGLFGYQMDGSNSAMPVTGAPYLVAHSGPTEMGGALPVIVMYSVMNSPEFTGENGGRVSLNDVIGRYRGQLPSDGYNSRFGIYLVEGIRAGVTALALARNFLVDSENYRLMGADLNLKRSVRATLNPHEGRISVYAYGPNQDEFLFSYRLGERREVSLGL